MRRLVLLAVATLCLAGACSGPGCEIAPLQRDLSPASLGSRAFEFYIPQMEGFSAAVMNLMAAQGTDNLRANLPVVEGSLGGPYSFATAASELNIPVSGVVMNLERANIIATLGLGATEQLVALEVLALGQKLRTCFLRVVIPQQVVASVLTLKETQDGKPAIVAEGTPTVVGNSIITELDIDCPSQPGGNIDPLVVGAVEWALQTGAQELTSWLAGIVGRAVGIDVDLAGTVGGTDGAPAGVHFLLRAGPGPVASGMNDLRLGLAGGFGSDQSVCVPLDALELPPASEPPAQFEGTVPEKGVAYGMGISLSCQFLRQGLAAAFRGGLLCRQAAAGDLAGVVLGDLFPSVQALGEHGAVRAAVWPRGQPGLELDPPDPSQGEILPRLVVTLPGLAVDLYLNLEGTDVRVLGLTADATVVLVPVLEGEVLRLELAEADLGGLEVSFSKLLTEPVAALQTAAAAAFQRVAVQLVKGIGPVNIPRPAGAAGELLGIQLTPDRLLLYFAP